MGLLDDFNPIKAVTRILPSPVRRIVAPVTKLATSITKLNPSTLLSFASKGPVLGPINFATQTLAPKVAPYVALGSNVATALVPGGGAVKMAVNLGNIFGAVSNAFSGSNNPYFNAVSNVATLAGQFVPTPVAMRLPAPNALAVRPPMGAVRALQGVGRGFFQKYPNLATSLQQLRDRGMMVKRSQLYNMLKRFGPEVLITGGLLTAAAVNELMVAGAGHRRMNAANGKALHRAARRIKSFHKMCGTIDLLKTRGRSRSFGRKCTTCRKNPCGC